MANNVRFRARPQLFDYQAGSDATLGQLRQYIPNATNEQLGETIARSIRPPLEYQEVTVGEIQSYLVEALALAPDNFKKFINGIFDNAIVGLPSDPSISIAPSIKEAFKYGFVKTKPRDPSKQGKVKISLKLLKSLEPSQFNAFNKANYQLAKKTLRRILAFKSMLKTPTGDYYSTENITQRQENNRLRKASLSGVIAKEKQYFRKYNTFNPAQAAQSAKNAVAQGLQKSRAMLERIIDNSAAEQQQNLRQTADQFSQIVAALKAGRKSNVSENLKTATQRIANNIARLQRAQIQQQNAAQTGNVQQYQQATNQIQTITNQLQNQATAGVRLINRNTPTVDQSLTLYSQQFTQPNPFTPGVTNTNNNNLLDIEPNNNNNNMITPVSDAENAFSQINPYQGLIRQN